MIELPEFDSLKKFLELEEKSSVGHVWSLRETLKSVLHEEGAWTLIGRCFKSRFYLEDEKGQRLLSWVVEHGPKQMIHHTVKSQLQICSRKDAEAYGKVYYKAWMESKTETRVEIEECLQDVINLVIHFHRKKKQAVFFNLCKFLNCFHQKKTAFEVNGMLIRVYQPIMWRSLKVANALVRWNAAYILYDVFPLGNPNANMEQDEIALIQQYKEMQALLEDPVPEVRCVATLGIFKCLNHAWQNIPNTVIRQWLDTLLNNCLRDGNSSKLRCNVIKGLTNLLSNPLCHQTIKALLPSVGDSFHDGCEKVREGFCNLLKMINKLEGFHYWDVVPLDHLLARLEQDSASICDLIVKVTCNNFLPANKSESLRLERSFFLFKSNPIAARIYIRHWCLLTDIDTVVSFMKLWHKTLESFVVLADRDSVNSDDDLVTLENSPLNDPANVSGIVEALLISWKTIQHLIKLEENQDKKKNLLQLFEKSMPKLLMFFKKSPSTIWNPLLLLSSSLKLDSLLTHFGRCMSCLEKLNEASVERDFSAVVGSLIYMGRGKQLLELLLDWLTKGILEPGSKEKPASALQASNSLKVRRTKKRVCFEEKPSKPSLAVAVLVFLLKYPELQRRIISDNRTFILQELLPLFDSIQELITHKLLMSDYLPFLQETAVIPIFNLHMQILLLLHRKEENGGGFSAPRSVESVMMWMSSAVVPRLKDELNQENARPSEMKTRSCKRKRQSTQKSSLAEQLIKTFLCAISDMLLLGVFDEDFLSSTTAFISSLIKTEKGSSFLDLVCRSYAILVDQILLNQSMPSGENISLISSLLSTIIWKLRINSSQEQNSMDLIVCRRALSQSLQIMFHHFAKSQVLTAELMALLLASIMADLGCCLSKVEPGELSEIPEAPPLTTFILSNLIGRAHSLKLLKELALFLNAGSLRQPLQILAVVCCFHHIISTIVEKTDGEYCGELKEAVNSAGPVLLKIAHHVKERFSQEEDFYKKPEVIYCRFAQKCLKELKKEVGLA